MELEELEKHEAFYEAQEVLKFNNAKAKLITDLIDTTISNVTLKRDPYLSDKVFCFGDIKEIKFDLANGKTLKIYSETLYIDIDDK